MWQNTFLNSKTFQKVDFFYKKTFQSEGPNQWKSVYKSVWKVILNFRSNGWGETNEGWVEGLTPLLRMGLPRGLGPGSCCRIWVPQFPSQVDVRTVKNPKMTSKRRTDLKIWPSKAKNLEELDFDVRKSLAPRKSTENDEKPRKKNPNFFPKIFFRRQKIEICKSSETRVAEVSWRSERSSRGNRTFEVRRRLGGTRGA